MKSFSVQDVFTTYGPEYIKKHKLSKEQWKVYNSIINCKTPNLGKHLIICKTCGEIHSGINSCRDRHCPTCQHYAKEKWIEKESANILDCPYFHIVNTIPCELNEIVMFNKKVCYDILFEATSESILTLANDKKWLGAKIGLTSILHTWGQNMQFHPHIHTIAIGGGLKNNKWIECKNNFLFKVQVLSSLFRGKFLDKLKEANLTFPEDKQDLYDEKNFNKFLEPLYEKEWVTYIEPPKGQPDNVIEYIGRYAFRVAISDNRIKDVCDGKVTFEYKDYKDDCKIKEMTITAEEFIRRFLLHVLPEHFTKVRHYGLLANKNKKANLALCRILLRTTVKSDFSILQKNSRVTEFKCKNCGNTSFTYIFYYPYSTKKSTRTCS